MNNNQKPDWIKVKALSYEAYLAITSVSSKYNLHTVCQEALCPNVNECWSSRTATFLLMGNICTRNCRFCSVKTGNPEGYLDIKEPINIAKAISKLGLKYIVLTSVDRDDLEDCGVRHFAQTVTETKRINPDVTVETLIPDFGKSFLEKLIASNPDVVSHNIETIERLTTALRDKRASYSKSLEVLKNVKDINPATITKSAIQLGFGETETEIKKALSDLKEYSVDIIVIGQYLRPTEKQVPVAEYIHPEKFQQYKAYAESLGFKQVTSSPLARSSYKATL